MRSPPRATAPIRYLLLTLALSAAVGSSHAASGWLDRLREAVTGKSTSEQQLSTADIGRGLKEALEVGTANVVAQLGRPDGFNLDPAVRIPLPRDLERAKNVLARVGLDDSLTDLETRLNRAAEIATPRARALFMDAIRELTIDDVMAIYRGPEDAATRYFESKMAEPLGAEMTPVVDESLAEAGAVQLYDSMLERYRKIPFAPEVDADLTSYVVDEATDGIFFYLAEEEAAIRADPAKRTTELLERVFGR